MRWYVLPSAVVWLSCAVHEPEHSELQRGLNGPSCGGDAVARATCISQFCRAHFCDGQLRQDASANDYQWEPAWEDVQALSDAAGQETGIDARMLKAVAYGE